MRHSDTQKQVAFYAISEDSLDPVLDIEREWAGQESKCAGRGVKTFTPQELRRFAKNSKRYLTLMPVHRNTLLGFMVFDKHESEILRLAGRIMKGSPLLGSKRIAESLMLWEFKQSWSVRPIFMHVRESNVGLLNWLCDKVSLSQEEAPRGFRAKGVIRNFFRYEKGPEDLEIHTEDAVLLQLGESPRSIPESRLFKWLPH